MPDDTADIRLMLDAWRGQGADRTDPLRFGVIAALAQRAGRYDGPVRQLLQDRLAARVDDYANTIASTDADIPEAEDAASICTDAGISSPGPLRELLDQLGALQAPAERFSDADDATAAPAPARTPMPVLDEFQRLWSRIRTDSQLRQSLQSVPEDAGPLHSSTLLHRAMTLMQEASPGYLQHFIAYADALSWMEQLQEDGMLETPSPRSTGVKAPGKPRARKRAKPQ